MKGKSDTVPSQENRQGIDDRHQKIVSVLAAHKVALWEYDIRTGVCSFDEDYFRILGLTEAGVEFSDIDDFYRFAHPDDVSNYREAFGVRYEKCLYPGAVCREQGTSNLARR